jgi:hypothetical protein
VAGQGDTDRRFCFDQLQHSPARFVLGCVRFSLRKVN